MECTKVELLLLATVAGGDVATVPMITQIIGTTKDCKRYCVERSGTGLLTPNLTWSSFEQNSTWLENAVYGIAH